MCSSDLAPLALANAAHLPELPFELEGDGVFVEAFKRAEKSADRILRLGEVKGLHSAVRLRVKEGTVFFCDALEWQQGDAATPDAAGWITIPFHPFEVRTLRIRSAEGFKK